jgi:DNA modification methylase
MNIPDLNHLLAKADALAAEAEARRAKADAIRNAIAVLAELTANDDDQTVAAPVAVDAAPNIEAATAAPPRKGVADADLLATLGHEFKAVGSIRAALVAMGITVVEATVYNRMRKLAAAHPNLIEAEAKPERWRLKAKAPAPVMKASAKKAPVKIRKVPAAAAPATTPKAANDAVLVLPTSAAAPTLHHGDGLAMMHGLPDASVDLVLADLPYGMTGLKIDPTIDLDAWMTEMTRIVTSRGAIVCFGAHPFTNKLINAAPDLLKQELIWEKPKATGFQQSANWHLKAHENILIFSKGTVIGSRSKRAMTFNPQGATKVEKITAKRDRTVNYLANTHSRRPEGTPYIGLKDCPRSVLRFGKDSDAEGLHPFAKPVALLEYLIRSYSNENALVLDPTMGSGSTIIAAVNTGRRAVGAENGTDRKGRCIFSIAEARVEAALAKHAA